MVNKIHYRWDFIGLSTDTKPTPEDSPKVVNGSTFYESDTSKLFVFYKDTWYERKPLGGGGGGGGTSDFDQLSNRPKYNNVTMSGSTSIPKVPTATSELTNDSGFVTNTSYATNTTGGVIKANGAFGLDMSSSGELRGRIYGSSDYPTMWNDALVSKGTLTVALADKADTALNGTSAPTTATAGTYVGQLYLDTTNDKMYYLSAIDTTTPEYTWAEIGGGPNVVQSTGTSTTDVMSQNAVTSMVFADPATMEKIKIGAGTSTSEGNNAIEIGHNAAATATNSIALGYGATTSFPNAIAIGRNASSQGNTSICMGQSATASRNNAVVIGSYANASELYSVALGFGSTSSVQGEVGIGLAQAYSANGYNNSAYRLLTGLYDGQNDHDAATVGQINATIDAINTALSTSIPHIGA